MSSVKGVTNRYTLLVGLAFLVLIAVATIHTLTGGGEHILGLEDEPPRWPIPEFAVPVATGNLEGDANVYQDDCGSASLPCPESPPRVPACQITTAGAIRVHGWQMPVGFDRDGAVAALFQLAACPTFAYVYPGGTLQSSSLGELGVG